MEYTSAYKKLRADYEHCLKRTMDLFEYGRRRELELETAVANAHKYIGVIKEKTDNKEIIEMCDGLMELMLSSLNGCEIKKPDISGDDTTPPHADMIIEWARTGREVYRYTVDQLTGENVWVRDFNPEWLSQNKYSFNPDGDGNAK